MASIGVALPSVKYERKCGTSREESQSHDGVSVDILHGFAPD
jgi:hypothetical protein